MDEAEPAGEKVSALRFVAVASKSHAHIAGEMAEQIKQLIYEHSEKIPLALAIGVLRIVEKELLDEAESHEV